MSDVKQFLDKDGLNALWNKTCSTFIPNRPSTKFYPFIGTASRGTSYKVTLPYNGVTASYKLYMMNTMEIVLGSSYQNGATGKIFLSYYFTRDTNGTWLANDLRAFAIGCNVAPTITYQISNPAIFWINLNSTSYNVISIKNLTAEDSAPSYDYRKTTIEAVTSVPTTGISSVPITILSNDGNKLKYNGNEIAVVNHTHDYLPLIGGTMSGPIVFNGTDSDRSIIRINNTTGDASKYGDFGFTLKYLGAGTGNNNALGLYSDDQSAPSQVMITRWMQDGTMYTRSITPFTSNNYKLGTPDYRWAEIYTKRIYADNLYEGSQLLSDKYADKSYADYCSSYLHSANRAQFCNPAGVTIEYSTNGGSTWADYGASDEDKTALFSGCQKIQFKMGKGLSSLSSANDALRITMDASNMGLYTRCKCILLNVSENGNTNYRVKVETSLKGSPDTYTTIIENQRITGWSGWNRIPINNIVFGGGANQTSNTGRIRLTFMTDGLNPVYGYTSGMHATVIDMEILGDTYWSYPHNMAKTGHIYSWDAAGNTIFDKNVTANTFIGNLNGNATSANKASALSSVTNGNTTTSAGTGEIIYSRFQQDMLGSLPGGDNANGVITINTHAGDYHHQLGFTGSGMFYRRRHGSALNNSASWSKIAMTSDIPTDYARVGDGSIYIYPQYGNEINFGGTNTKTELYFGYRGVDSKPAPTTYIFGRLDSLANIKAKFVGNLTGKADTAGSTVGTLTIAQPSGSTTFNGSTDTTININRTTLGLDKVMDYIGKTSTQLSDGSTTNPITIDSKSITAVSGNVVIDKDGGREYIWNGSAWELFGADDIASSYKPKQSVVNDPTASGISTTFIDTISQDVNGKITVTKKNIPTIPTSLPANGGNADTVDNKHASDFAYKQEFTIGANKYAKITGGEIFTAFISVGSTLGNARHMSCWSSYGSGQSIRTNIKHIINGTDIYIDESGTGPIIYIKGYSQQTVIHILCSLSSFTCEELSSLPANVSITNTNSNNYTLAVKSDIPTSLPWSSITSKPTFATVATTGSYNDLTNKPTIPAAVTVDTSLSSTSTNPVQNKVINDALGNKADKSETLLGYNLQERIEDLDLGTKNRFFRTGGSPSNAPGQNGYVVGLTMALNNDSEYRVQLAYDQSINRLSYRQQLGNKGWMNWKTMALLTDIPTIPTIGNGTITIKQNGTSKGTFTVNQTGDTTIELTDTTGITSQDHYKTSVTAGTAGTSSATSGSTLAVPYVTVNANGHVTGYGTHTHTISGFLTSHQPIYNLTMQAGAFSAVTFDPNGAAKTVNIPTKTSHLTNDSGFVDDKIKTPAITSFTTWDGVTKFGLRAWSNNATSRPSDYGIALDFAGDNGGYNWRNRLAFATEGKGIHYYYATNNNTLNYGGRLITTKGDYTLNGNLTAKAYYISSDERLKTFGDDIKVDFDELAKLRKSHFVFNNNPTKQEIGVSAQEVQKLYPEIVNETEEGTLSVDYSKLAVVALAAIDKLNQRVQELENKLAKYE